MRKPRLSEKVQLLKRGDGLYKVTKIVDSLDGVFVKETHKRGAKEEFVSLEDIVYLEDEKMSGEEKYKILESWVDSNYLPDNKIKFFQLSVLNRLVKQYPDLSFWKNYIPEFKVKNLLWYFGDGEKILKIAYNGWKIDLTSRTKSLMLGTEKVGEDYVLKGKKQKSIIDIIK